MCSGGLLIKMYSVCKMGKKHYLCLWATAVRMSRRVILNPKSSVSQKLTLSRDRRQVGASWWGGKHAVRVWSQWSQIRMSLWSRGSHTVQFEGDHEILKKQSECKALILFQCHVLKTMLYPHLVVSKVPELLKICLQICCYVFLYQHHVKVFIKK